MRPAILWKSRPDNHVQCVLCAHFCNIADGETGKCHVRMNWQGELYTLVADTIAALNIDPVEKKPLFHFLPGTETLSFGTQGCNFSCLFCQNFQLSQPLPDSGFVLGTTVSPEELIRHALRAGTKSISYTYSEPTIFAELASQTAEQACEHGLKNILVSNAFQSPQALSLLKEIIHAANFDLKSFSDAFYQNICGARLKPVLNTIKKARKFGWWIEITTLLIPGYNDSKSELEAIANFIHDELGKDVPWHVSRFHPTFKLLKAPPTPISSIERALEAGSKYGVRYVYSGNIPGHKAENTYCYKCGQLLVSRIGFTTTYNGDGTCPACAVRHAGVWK
ncbi:AmmeMemoRadiSam system radical SAM enzyme [Oleidesulfovibrio sp.]|uniref:AmmeMemoRadiSam system radical SAM enzyme n=1 Tax=Oleidesulfovibrio sp. TaxID=2909707 RepID=UPI003A89A850